MSFIRWTYGEAAAKNEVNTEVRAVETKSETVPVEAPIAPTVVESREEGQSQEAKLAVEGQAGEDEMKEAYPTPPKEKSQQRRRKTRRQRKRQRRQAEAKAKAIEQPAEDVDSSPGLDKHEIFREAARRSLGLG